jgi:NhaP-type Na+/H+ or K+/H+ antiporter
MTKQGTAMNAFLVAGLLMGMGHGLHAFNLANDMSFQEILIFSTIIAAVDPVAVSNFK